MSGPAPIKITIAGFDRTGAFFGSVGKKVDTFAAKVEGIGKKVRGFGVGLAGVGIGGAAALGLTALPGQILRVEQALARLKFTENFSEEDIKGIAQGIKEISVASLQSQEALISPIDKIGDAGFNLKETMKIVSTSAKAATAFGKPIGSMADAAYTLGANFKIAADNMDEAFDILGRVGTTNVEIDELNGLLSKAGTSAKAFGVTGIKGLGQVAAALEIVRAGTGNATQATKALSKLYEGIIDPDTVKKFKDPIEGPGVDIIASIKEGTAQGQDALEAYLRTVKRVTDSQDVFVREQRINKLFGTTDSKAIRALLDNIDGYTEALKANANTRGTIERGLQAQLGTTLGQWEKLKLTLQTTNIEPLSNAFKSVNGWLKEINGNAKVTSALFYGIGGSIIAGGTLIVLGQLTMSLKNVAGAMILISKTLPILGSAIASNPILALAAALAGIGAIAYVQAKNAADAAGTDGLQKDSAARQALNAAAKNSEANSPLAQRIAALHKGFEGNNPFANVQSPAPSNQKVVKAVVDVNLNGLPPGSKVKTKSDKNVQVNPSLGYLAFP